MGDVWQAYVMDDVSTGGEVAPGVAFNWPLVRNYCRERGAKTVADCAEVLGVNLRTLERLRAEPQRAKFVQILQIHMSTRIPLDDLVSVGGAVEREAA